MAMQDEEILGKAYDSRLMKRLLHYLKPYRLYVGIGIVTSILVSAMEAGATAYLVKGCPLAELEGTLVRVIDHANCRLRLQGSQADTVGMLMVEARGARQVADAQREVTSLLKQRHRLAEAAEPDFQFRNLTEIQNSANEQTNTLSVLLGSIALISLVVGAIGIANVMLVSVTERTREIGIRMAVGARGRDVLVQFLTEAVVLAAIGGLIGLGLGALVSWVMAVKADWPTLLSPGVMLGTVLLAGLAGVVAGFYPALRASRLDPIEALRYE